MGCHVRRPVDMMPNWTPKHNRLPQCLVHGYRSSLAMKEKQQKRVLLCLKVNRTKVLPGMACGDPQAAPSKHWIAMNETSLSSTTTTISND